MFDVSLYDKLEINQLNSLWRHEQERFNSELVYCAMCEVKHENNTNCQRND